MAGPRLPAAVKLSLLLLISAISLQHCVRTKFKAAPSTEDAILIDDVCLPVSAVPVVADKLLREGSRETQKSRSDADINSIPHLDQGNQGDNWDKADQRTGFVLAVHFWDQQTFSVLNILALQRWASWVGVHTLEPFLVKTKFRLPFDEPGAFHGGNVVSHMKLSDIYDLEDWNSESCKLNFQVNPLMTWDHFLTHAVTDIVYIKLSRNWRTTNDDKCELKEVASYNNTLTKLGFKIVEARCVFLPMAKTITLPEFKVKVYGSKYLPQRTTVLFSEWSYSTIQHVIVEDNSHIIPDNTKLLLPLKPSKRVLSDAKRYMGKYLPSEGRYIGILVRTEWYLLSDYRQNRENILKTCLNKVIRWVDAAIEQTQLASVFVGMDIGNYGSTTLKDLSQDYVLNVGEHFLQATYNTMQMTIAKWEATFRDISESEEPAAGYVAFLQKTIATLGKCLILIGSGSFQRHALHTYRQQHLPQDHCYLQTGGQCAVKSVVGFIPQ